MSLLLKPKGALYIGGETCAESDDFLRMHKIKAVVNCTNNRIGNNEGNQHNGKNISYYPRLGLEDEPTEQHALQAMLPNVIKWIHKHLVVKGNNVLIHCHMGKSRSAAVTIAYLMVSRTMSYEEALEFLKRKRSIVCPNGGFAYMLERWIGF
jgi:protein-tyrosine phosphatase